MNLEEALGDWSSGGNNQSGGGGAWPGQPSNPTWPGQPAANPTWPSGGAGAGGGAWPSGGGGAGGGAWPSGGGGAGGGGGAWPSPQPQPPAPGGGWSNPSPGPGPAVAPQQSLTVPYSQNFPGGLHDKMLITIAGTTKHNADKIVLDLYTSSNDLAFHFNPRFNEGGKKVIVRNHRVSNKWGKEERELQRFPFVPGQAFEMKILCTNSEFKVAVNGSHLLAFQHRIRDLRSINRLNIYHDLDLSKFLIENLP